MDIRAEQTPSQIATTPAGQGSKQLGAAVTAVIDYSSRWGSCNLKDNVSLNWRLIKAPMFVIDYVIAHELAHLIEANHTPQFWSILRAQLPVWRRLRFGQRRMGSCWRQWFRSVGITVIE